MNQILQYIPVTRFGYAYVYGICGGAHPCIFCAESGSFQLLCKLEVPNPRQELETCGAISGFRNLIK